MTLDTSDYTAIRAAVRAELGPMHEQQSRLIAQQASLVRDLTRELEATQRALALTRGSLKGHAEGMGRVVWVLLHPLVKSAVFALTVMLAARHVLAL